MINIHQAKTNFSKLVNAALMGNETVIAKAGVPVAKLVPITTDKPKRKPGALKGKMEISDDFDAPLPQELLNKFQGKE